MWETKLSTLDKRIRDFLQGYRQNIAILGNDSDEISYLLDNYFQENKLESLIYIHLNGSYASALEVFKKGVFSLLSSYLDKAVSLDELINLSSAFTENTTNFIKDTLKKNNVSFSDFLEVLNRFINDTGRKCILIIDEFLCFEGVFRSFFKDFTKFIILQRNCMVILVSSQSKANKVISTELNLLFGNFEKLYLDDTYFFDYYSYLRNRIQSLNVSGFFLSFFVKIIGSNLTYYDLISSYIQKNYRADAEEPSIISAIEEALYLRETYFFQRFIKKVDAVCTIFRSPLALKILTAISDGYIRRRELFSLSLCDAKQLGAKLQRLSELDYVENLGDIYRIKDNLFSFWLSHVFKIRHNFPLLDLDRRRNFWRKKVEEEIALFKEEYLKTKIEKILGLLSSSSNDTLKVGKNRLRFPSIERTKIASYPDKSLHLIVGEGKDMTFIGVKETQTCDNDIIEFLERVSTVRAKNIRKIFISLGDFSSSAKLIAKNHRLTIWDANEVNSLLSIYNKPILSFDRY